MELDTSAEAARAALWLIWRSTPETELVEISVRTGGGNGRWGGAGKLRGRGGWRTVVCTVAQALGGGELDGVEAARRVSQGGADAYIGACSLREAPPLGRRGGSGLRGSGGCVWLDVDCAGPGREQGVFAGVEEAVAAVDRALGAWAGRALVVGSGWGVQYWLPIGVSAGNGIAAVQAAAASRGLAAEVNARFGAAGVVGKADKTGDPARVMRMPGTWNWRGGPGLERGTGVLRWPADGADGLSEGDVAWLVARAARELGAGAAGAGSGTYGGGSGGPWMDVETLADRVLAWADVLVPWGWTRSGVGAQGEEVWARPNRAGERSAVVFKDGAGELTVFSTAGECGFVKGLRRTGGSSAAAGVVSKWRAWVDLAWGGDRNKALEAVHGAGEDGGEDGVSGVLRAAWAQEYEEARSWAAGIEELAMEKKWGSVRAEQEWQARRAAALAERSA